MIQQRECAYIHIPVHHWINLAPRRLWQRRATQSPSPYLHIQVVASAYQRRASPSSTSDADASESSKSPRCALPPLFRDTLRPTYGRRHKRTTRTPTCAPTGIEAPGTDTPLVMVPRGRGGDGGAAAGARAPFAPAPAHTCTRTRAADGRSARAGVRGRGGGAAVPLHARRVDVGDVRDAREERED